MGGEGVGRERTQEGGEGGEGGGRKRREHKRVGRGGEEGGRERRGHGGGGEWAHLTSNARASIPAAKGADALVPVCWLVQTSAAFPGEVYRMSIDIFFFFHP